MDLNTTNIWQGKWTKNRNFIAYINNWKSLELLKIFSNEDNVDALCQLYDTAL